jgi:serine/threonine-protein kinase HipA
MSRILDVYLHRQRAGALTQNNQGDIVFEYDGNYLGNPSARPLSQSLPLAQKRFNRRECRPFFAGVLPEESKREIIAHNLGISAKNDFALLEQIGGECAGAVTFLPKGTPLPACEDAYRPLSETELASILRSLPKRPLLAGEAGIRLSLAGAQDKIAVKVEGGTICLPLNGSPSTHILKPRIERFEGVVFNEELCMRLSTAVGIPTAGVRIGVVEGIHYILVERYDRARVSPPGGGQPRLLREHQEDFCQALGIVSEHKYQGEGGPSLKQCFELVRNTSSLPLVDLQSLLNAVIFNLLIGNNDAHGKNFSLIYRTDGQTRLAPLYDLVSTVAYPELSPRMAMKIGGEYDSEKVGPKQIGKLADEAALSIPMVQNRVAELADAVMAALRAAKPEEPFAAGLAVQIRNRCQRIIQRFKKQV